jgi:hypothetical protein
MTRLLRFLHAFAQEHIYLVTGVALMALGSLALTIIPDGWVQSAVGNGLGVIGAMLVLRVLLPFFARREAYYIRPMIVGTFGLVLIALGPCLFYAGAATLDTIQMGWPQTLSTFNMVMTTAGLYLAILVLTITGLAMIVTGGLLIRYAVIMALVAQNTRYIIQSTRYLAEVERRMKHDSVAKWFHRF